MISRGFQFVNFSFYAVFRIFALAWPFSERSNDIKPASRENLWPDYDGLFWTFREMETLKGPTESHASKDAAVHGGTFQFPVRCVIRRVLGGFVPVLSLGRLRLDAGKMPAFPAGITQGLSPFSSDGKAGLSRYPNSGRVDQ